MKQGDFNKIKKDIESGFSKVFYQTGVNVGKPVFFVINETRFALAHFSKNQIAYLTENGEEKINLLKSYSRLA